MKRFYTLYDVFDMEKANPILQEFHHKLKVKAKFDLKDVTYLVTRLFKKDRNNCAIIKMVRYKIGNTHTSHTHQCPARQMQIEHLSLDQLEKLEKKHTKKQIKAMKAGRVKLRGHMETRCPYCKVVFWKESMEFPEKVVIDGVMDDDFEEGKSYDERV